MTTPDIAFLDTETTSLRRDRRAWEVAIIKRVHKEDGSFKDNEHHYFVKNPNLLQADLFALKIGGFRERHKNNGDRTYEEHVLAEEIQRLLWGAHIVANVPDFDTWTLESMLRRHERIATWHYHLLDVENLIVGYIRGLQQANEDVVQWSDNISSSGMANILSYDCQPPWNSEELSRLIGIEPPDESQRHTALGDARWARDSYDRVMGIS